MIAALSARHERHEATARALARERALPAHVLIEAYAVLTRLPAGLAVPAAAAATVSTRRFDDAPLRPGAEDRRNVLQRLADSGVAAGATYDGLVALEAAAHGLTLLTLDERAQATYRRLGIDFKVIGA